LRHSHGFSRRQIAGPKRQRWSDCAEV
jgi:hypothetical protein